MFVPLTIADFIDRADLVYGDRVATIDEPGGPGSLGTVTYGELAARARGMARALDVMGVGPGERVAIVSPNSARFLTSFFGVSAHGRALVPINFRLTTAEVQYVVEHSGASVVLIDPELDEQLAGVTAKHRILLDGVEDAELFAPAAPGEEPEPWAADELATASVNYTSGTTAMPKGVQLTHRGCWLNAATFGWHFTVRPEDVYLHTLPMFHCNGWGVPYVTTAMGCAQIVLRKIDGEEVLRRIEEHGVTFLCAAPAVVSAVLDAAEARRADGREIPGRDVVRMLVAGAPPPSRTIERVETDLGWEFMQLYGLTETSPLLTLNRSSLEYRELTSEQRAVALARAGVPAVGVRLQIDEEGEVLARSNNVFAGYWNQPEETAKALADDWFHTGDGGRLDGPYLTISDRKKDVIITGGENVSSIEVEDTLYQHPAVAEAAVIGVPDEKWGETIKALVVLRAGHDVGERELIDFCRNRMAHFKAPTSVEIRPELARTATGKLQKFKLRAPYWEGRDRHVN